MKTLLLLAVLISGNSFAKSNIEKIEIYPPMFQASCENEDYDRVGSLGLQLTSISAYVVNDRIAVTSTNQLWLCSDLANDGTKIKMRWVNVDPFKGFEVPYYNGETNQRDTYHQVIINADSSNKFEVRYLSEETYKTIESAPMISAAKGSFKGTLTIAQADLLDQNDLDLLVQGKEVSKRVEMDHVSAMTRIFRNPRLNDVSTITWTGRYIKFTFKQINGQLKMSSLAIE
jgi:hypothetical protein